MLQSFTQLQKLGQENLDATMKALSAFTSNAQTIAAESADYARKSLEQGSSAVEKLLGAQSLEKAIEVQTSFAKGTYESLVAQSAKLGALYTSLASETFKPYEGVVSKVTKG